VRPITQVLLVEDNPGDARLLHEMLKEPSSLKTELKLCCCVGDAESHLVNNVPDVIFLDLGLPDAPGLEAVRRMRGASPRAPVVVLTGPGRRIGGRRRPCRRARKSQPEFGSRTCEEAARLAHAMGARGEEAETSHQRSTIVLATSFGLLTSGKLGARIVSGWARAHPEQISTNDCTACIGGS